MRKTKCGVSAVMMLVQLCLPTLFQHQEHALVIHSRLDGSSICNSPRHPPTDDGVMMVTDGSTMVQTSCGT